MIKTVPYLSLFVLTFFSLFFSPVAYAGGGTYQLNISNGQTISGNQFDVVVTVTDNTKPEPFPLVIGEEFEVVAHPESAGERCETFQKKTDGSGQFKARCYSDQSGKFAFHLHPITRTDLPDSGSWEVFFQLQASPTPTPASTSPSPSASPKASPSPSASVAASTSPKPSSSPKASASPKASPSPSPKASPSPTPSPSPSVVASSSPAVSPSPSTAPISGGRPSELQIMGGVVVAVIALSAAGYGGWYYWNQRKSRLGR
jgi:hypothetical protein